MPCIAVCSLMASVTSSGPGRSPRSAPRFGPEPPAARAGSRVAPPSRGVPISAAQSRSRHHLIPSVRVPTVPMGPLPSIASQTGPRRAHEQNTGTEVGDELTFARALGVPSVGTQRRYHYMLF